MNIYILAVRLTFFSSYYFITLSIVNEIMTYYNQHLLVISHLLLEEENWEILFSNYPVNLFLYIINKGSYFEYEFIQGNEIVFDELLYLFWIYLCSNFVEKNHILTEPESAFLEFLLGINLDLRQWGYVTYLMTIYLFFFFASVCFTQVMFLY